MGTPPILVAVMGVTGSGKTSYVAGLTGRADVVPGEDLESSTPEIMAYDACIDGTEFRIVDTPGFNDTYQTESMILGKLAEWLSSTYRDGQKLTGLIYLHSIAKSRATGTSRLNLTMFQQLCGQDSYQNITLCTTFWDSVVHTKGEWRETQLLNKDALWGEMIQKGARTERIYDYSDLRSRSILLRFAEEEETVLAVQKEMVDDNKSLQQTGAGKVVEDAELDQAAGALGSLRILSDQMEKDLAQRRINRRLQAQQHNEHQQSIQDLNEKYKREARERETQAIEAKEKEKLLAEKRLQRQKEENRKAQEERAAAEREQAARVVERRKIERQRKEEDLRQRARTRISMLDTSNGVITALLLPQPRFNFTVSNANLTFVLLAGTMVEGVKSIFTTLHPRNQPKCTPAAE